MNSRQQSQQRGTSSSKSFNMREHLIIQSLIKKNNWFLIVLFICFSWQFWLWYEFIIDDTYISLVYVKNLLEGRGLTYNGIVVEGFSNFLWVMIIYLLSLPLGDPLLATKVAGFIFGLLILYLLPKLGDKLTGSYWPGLLAGLLLSLDFTFMPWMVGGLEAPLLAVLLLFVLYQIYLCNSPLLIGGLAALIAMTRPEGFGFLPLIVIGDWILHRHWKRTSIIIGSFALIFIPFLIWRFLRYGDILPTTVYAKQRLLRNQVVAGQLYMQEFLRAYRIPLATGVISTGIFLLELVRTPELFMKQAVGISKPMLRQGLLFVPLLLFVVGYSGFIVMAGGDWMPAFRFFAPLMPLIYLYIFSSILLATRKAPSFIFLGIVFLLLFRQVFFLSAIRTDFVTMARDATSGLIGFGKWLKVHADPTDVIALIDAGAIPYYSGLKTIDSYGLNDAYIAHLPGEMGKKVDVDYILSYDPEYIEIHVLPSIDGQGFVIPDHPGSIYLYYSPEFQRWYEFIDGKAPIYYFKRRQKPLFNTFLDDYYNVGFHVEPALSSQQDGKWCSHNHISLRITIRNVGTGVWIGSNFKTFKDGVVDIYYKLKNQSNHIVTENTLSLPRDLSPGEEESLIVRLPPVVQAGSYSLNLDLELTPLWSFSSKKANDHSKVPIKIEDCP